MREVHRIPDRADEQSKEAGIVPLLTPPRTIWIDWSTGEICTPEPIEPGGQVSIHRAAPRFAWKKQTAESGIRDEVFAHRKDAAVRCPPTIRAGMFVAVG
jgi:hypothetical protein